MKKTTILLAFALSIASVCVAQTERIDTTFTRGAEDPQPRFYGVGTLLKVDAPEGIWVMTNQRRSYYRRLNLLFQDSSFQRGISLASLRQVELALNDQGSQLDKLALSATEQANATARYFSEQEMLGQALLETTTDQRDLLLELKASQAELKHNAKKLTRQNLRLKKTAIALVCALALTGGYALGK